MKIAVCNPGEELGHQTRFLFHFSLSLYVSSDSFIFVELCLSLWGWEELCKRANSLSLWRVIHFSTESSPS